MFPDDYTIRMVRQEQVKDWLRDLERERLVRLALAGRDRRARFYCQVLASLGRQMVTWGRRLQERYGAVIEGYRIADPGPQPKIG
jgi:hypothetical protein